MVDIHSKLDVQYECLRQIVARCYGGGKTYVSHYIQGGSNALRAS